MGLLTRPHPFLLFYFGDIIAQRYESTFVALKLGCFGPLNTYIFCVFSFCS